MGAGSLAIVDAVGLIVGKILESAWRVVAGSILVTVGIVLAFELPAEQRVLRWPVRLDEVVVAERGTSG